MMDTVLSFAHEHQALALVLLVAVVVGGYLLLNRKPRAAREADRRFQELRDQSRNRYRGLRPPQ
jgi:hypothetical protein